MKYLQISIFSFLICLFSIGCKDKQSQDKLVVQEEMNDTINSTESAKKSKKTILCFGNSLTAGFGLEENQAWPHLLQERLDSLGMDYKVVNAGLSGETTAGGLNRINWVLSQDIDLFILELGANDMLRGIDVGSTEENLDSIITIVHQKFPGIPILIAGMLSPPNMGATYEQSFNGIFKNLIQNNNSHLIPFFLNNVAGIDTLNLPDGKHPNEEGQKIVLENVWNYMKDLL